MQKSKGWKWISIGLFSTIAIAAIALAADAPYSTPWTNGAPVSNSNPMPVTGTLITFPPSPGPWPTSTPGGIPKVNLADATGLSLNVAPAATASAGASPPASALYVNAIAHCYYTGSLASPTPAASPGNIITERCDKSGFQHTSSILYGSSGNQYVETLPDAVATSAATTGPGTATILAGSAGHVTYLHGAWWNNTGAGTTSASTFRVSYGTGGCATIVQDITPALSTGATAGSGSVLLPLYATGSVDQANTTLGEAVNIKAFPVPAGDDVCGIGVGIVNDGQFRILYARP
jgi:hypothetical protein